MFIIPPFPCRFLDITREHPTLDNDFPHPPVVSGSGQCYSSFNEDGGKQDDASANCLTDERVNAQTPTNHEEDESTTFPALSPDDCLNSFEYEEATTGHIYLCTESSTLTSSRLLVGLSLGTAVTKLTSSAILVCGYSPHHKPQLIDSQGTVVACYETVTEYSDGTLLQSALRPFPSTGMESDNLES